MLIVLLLKFLLLLCSVVVVAVDPIGFPSVDPVVLLLLLLVLGECNRLLAICDTDSCRLWSPVGPLSAVAAAAAAVVPVAGVDPAACCCGRSRFDVGDSLLNGVSTYSLVSLSFSGLGAARVTGDVADAVTVLAAALLASKLGPKMLGMEIDGKAAGGRRREKVLAGCTRL